MTDDDTDDDMADLPPKISERAAGFLEEAYKNPSSTMVQATLGIPFAVRTNERGDPGRFASVAEYIFAKAVYPSRELHKTLGYMAQNPISMNDMITDRKSVV